MNVSHSHSCLSVVSTDEDRGLGNMSGSYLSCRSPPLSCPLHSQAELNLKRFAARMKENGDWQRREWMLIYFLFFLEGHFVGCSLRHSLQQVCSGIHCNVGASGWLSHNRAEMGWDTCLNYDKRQKEKNISSISLNGSKHAQLKRKMPSSTALFTNQISISKKTTCRKASMSCCSVRTLSHVNQSEHRLGKHFPWCYDGSAR